MNARLLPLRSVPELARRRRDPVSKQALAEAAPIVDAVRTGGEAALREYAERFGDVRPEGGAGAPLFYDRAALREALDRPGVRAAATYLVEIKAAAVDVVCEAAAERGARVVFCDNVPVSLPGEPDLDGELLRMAGEAVGAHA